MKLLQIISQSLFIRTNDGTGYDVKIQGDITISTNNFDDMIEVYHDGTSIEIIDVREATLQTGVFTRMYEEIPAGIIITKYPHKEPEIK